MKKILLIVVLCVVAYIGCKKAEKLESNLVSVDEETIVVEDDNATITASYTYNYTIKSSKIIYSTNNNLSSAQSQNITAENGHIVVYLDNLQKRTTYYYCFEFYSGYNTMSTEINSFTTLGAVLPQVETADIHDITMTTAIGGGNVVNDGSDEITARGVCWNTLENPTIDNNHTSDGTGVGAFVSNISDLNENTIYYIRAYAKNSAGIGYGAQKVFKTQQNPAMPTVTTNDVTDITETGALCGGIVSSEGTSSVVARGVCWSSSDEPFVTDNHTVDGNGLGQFVSVIDNLEPNTNYYVKAYATNSFGTSYGEIKTFTTNQILSTPIVITNAEVLNITPFSASCGGTIISDGNSPIISKGICWSLSPDPTTNNFKTDEGPGMSSFTSVMSGLEQNTVYYVKAYAINGIGTSYGDQREFTTLINQQLPLVTTDIPSEIGLTSARCGGSVTDDGNAEVYDRGICWSLYDYPTITDNVISMGNGIGAFSDIIDGLDEETRYYVRAYATNVMGTNYGYSRSFITGHSVVGPTVVTKEVTEITQTDASTGGNVVSDGGGTVSSRGVCYSTHQNPTLEDEVKQSGFGTGEFDCHLDYLESGTTYYVRAYATNEIETSYGQQEMFTTALDETLPTVITAEVSNIELTSAVCGGNVTDDGNLPVTARGICWSTHPQPSLEDSFTEDGEGLGSFESLMEFLNPNTTYFVRAYATNYKGTAYGEDKEFQTPTDYQLPTVLTDAPSDIGVTSARCGGIVTDDGNSEVTNRGVCWSLADPPTIDDNVMQMGSGIGSFSEIIEGFEENTRYYVRAYAINMIGTNYGDSRTFITGHNVVGPTVITKVVTDITETTAMTGGEVTSDGGAEIIERGVCYGINQNPTINDMIVQSGSGIGEFDCLLENLDSGVTYYVRAYATNEVETAYGQQETFTTDQEQSLPIVETSVVTNIGQTSATCGGNVLSDGNSSVTARGVCWSRSQNPTIANSHTTDGTGTGQFVSSITNLQQNTTYYVRAYATNGIGTAYGEQKVLTTDSPEVPEGALNGLFSVSPYKQVFFSQGCLKYQASTRIWRLADNQYDYVGNDNHNISQTYTGWIDTYCWGTSGWNSGANQYQPWAVSPNDNDYLPGGSTTSDLTDDYINADWCFYNAIENAGNQSGLWRTLTKDEWAYLIETRNNNPLYGNGQTTNNYLSFKCQLTIQGTQYIGVMVLADNDSENVQSSNYATTSWSSVPQLTEIPEGAAFLVGGPNRQGTTIIDIHSYGNYYSTTHASSTNAYYFNFNQTAMLMQGVDGRHFGFNVRPVAEIDNPYPKITTNIVSNITGNSATCGGSVISQGSSGVTARGVCWSSDHTPSISDPHTTDGSGTGSFTSNITGLSPATTYYVRAYATNSYGTVYGNEVVLFTEEDQIWPNGILPGLFSVSANQYVKFSQGNLQYIGSASTPYFKFAYRQWSFLGYYGQTYEDPNIDRDLFGWGTSGYNHGAICYQPYSYEQDYTKYYAYGSPSNDLNSNSGMADWGYNQISNGGNTTNMWRTLTMDEWNYIFNIRNTNSGIRFVKAVVNDINGVILLPDNWNATTYTLNEPNNGSVQYSTNVISETTWMNVLEPAGVVFLTTAGIRNEMQIVSGTNSLGTYWSATHFNNEHIRKIFFNNNSLNADSNLGQRCFSSSVRLVHDAESPMPTVTTSNVSNITQNSATCGGNVTSQGSSAVTARGVCWSTSQNPTISDSYTTDGSGTGSFTSSITGLNQGTTYYVRAYATNSDGTAYGNEVSFTTTVSTPTGAIPGLFSVSSNKQVYISKGNLQYRASTNTWRFAEHQYDYVGEDNMNASSTYDGWIDLFGYGTSGYNEMYPYKIGGNNSEYPVGDISNTQYDWGVYNAISNGGGQPGMWRTITQTEKGYLIGGRPNWANLRGKGTVCGVHGSILLPDSWVLPSGVTFVPNTGGWTTNVYDSTQWEIMESAGAVFFPASGERMYTVYNLENYSFFRTSSEANDTDHAWIQSMNETSFTNASYFKMQGLPVRLIKDF